MVIRKETIAILEEVKTIDDSIYQYNPVYVKALNMAIAALKREQQFLDSGYENGKVEFMIGGRKFMVKEIAQ